MKDMEAFRVRWAFCAFALAWLCAAPFEDALGGTMVHSFAGAGYSGPALVNFPVSIMLAEGANGFSYSGFADASSGADLRVKDSSGNLLPHEIEKWDSSGLSLVWVKVPSLSSSTTLTLSWGDASAPSSDGSVWSDAWLVYHLGGCGPKESAQGIPSTQSVTNVVSAPSGQGSDFAGRADTSKRVKSLFSDAYRTKLANGQAINSFTISFWMKADDFTTTATYLSYLYRGGGEHLDVLYNFDSARARKVTLNTVGAAGTDPASVSAIDVPDLGWHHYAYTYDGTTLCKYRDGVLTDAPAVMFSIPDSHPEWNTEFHLGGHDAANMFAGSLDEFRFEKVARSTDWIKACCVLSPDRHWMEFPEYGRNSTLEDFPLMIALNRNMPGLSPYMQSAIYDREHLHFYAEDGTELPAEPEITPTNGTDNAVATYWVKMPSFASGTKVMVRPTEEVNAYSSSNWDSTYYHVWHLAARHPIADSVSTSPLSLYGSGHDWTNFPAFVGGPSGAYGAMQCGPNMLVYAETNNDARSLTNQYTISFWARKSAADFADPQPRYVFQLRESSYGDARQICVLTGFRNHDNDFYLWDSAHSSNGNGGPNGDGPHVAIPDDGWHHYAFVCDGSSTKGYRDGVQDAIGDVFDMKMPGGITTWHRMTMAGERWSVDDRPEAGGSSYMAATRSQFRGALDEFRIELEPRSADWIYACCRTQRGLADGRACLLAPVFGTERSVSATTATSLEFKADLICRIASDVTFYYGAADAGTTPGSWSGSVSLGSREGGVLSAEIGSLGYDQGVVGRFCASNDYGVVWSEPLSGRSWSKPHGRCANMTVCGYTGAPLEDFPLCVKLPQGACLPKDKTADEAGMRFTDADGMALPFEVERWNPSGESVFWVRVPRLFEGLRIRAMWGDSFSARGTQHAETVWSGDFRAVYHLASANDSSPNARHFTEDTLSDDADGVVGRARDFTGRANSNMKFEKDDLPTDLLDAFTISGWIKPTGGASYLLQLFNGIYQFSVIYGFDASRRLRLYSWSQSGHGMINNYNSNEQCTHLRNILSPIDIPNDGGWHHFAYTCDNTGFGAYLDGNAVTNAGFNLAIGSAYTRLQGWRLVVGQSGSKGDRYVGGLDELRFESARRSADWIKACYLNQNGSLLRLTPSISGFMSIFR